MLEGLNLFIQNKSWSFQWAKGTLISAKISTPNKAEGRGWTQNARKRLKNGLLCRSAAGDCLQRTLEGSSSSLIWDSLSLDQCRRFKLWRNPVWICSLHLPFVFCHYCNLMYWSWRSATTRRLCTRDLETLMMKYRAWNWKQVARLFWK